MGSTSKSSLPSKDRLWLKDKVYDLKRGRTVELVKRSIASLMNDGKRISLATLSARSKEVDPGGKGISESAILNNPDARIYYQQQRSWKRPGSGSRQRVCEPVAFGPAVRIKPDRELARVRYRYLKLNKTGLVERLLAVEQAYADLQEQWFQLNEELLSSRLQTEAPRLRRSET